MSHEEARNQGSAREAVLSASHNQLMTSPHVILAALGMESPATHFVPELQPYEAGEGTSWF